MRALPPYATASVGYSSTTHERLNHDVVLCGREQFNGHEDRVGLQRLDWREALASFPRENKCSG